MFRIPAAIPFTVREEGAVDIVTNLALPAASER